MLLSAVVLHQHFDNEIHKISQPKQVLFFRVVEHQEVQLQEEQEAY